MLILLPYLLFFFFNDTATTEIYTLSLHDALPIWARASAIYHNDGNGLFTEINAGIDFGDQRLVDRKSTRLNSSHGYISYAVFCLKKKKKKRYIQLCIIINIYITERA